MNNKAQHNDVLKSMIEQSSNIVFFGGAGTSTESGIPDFRSASDLFQALNGASYAPEELLSRGFFMRDPESFYHFYKSKMIYPHAKPHAAHYALAELERQGKLRAVITQNIDGMHQLAGSCNVIELHGSVHRNYCMDCHAFASLEEVMQSDQVVPGCKQCQGTIKPDVVLYGENLHSGTLEQAKTYITEADILIVAGTSLTVYPAAGLLQYYRGKKLVLINQSVTPYDHLAHYVINEKFAKSFEHIT